jgi:hypothetical protein
MNKEKTLEILNEEKNYEDEIVAKLTENILDKLDSIPDLKAEECKIVRKNITTLVNDSKIHSKAFNELIQTVQKDDTPDKHW